MIFQFTRLESSILFLHLTPWATIRLNNDLFSLILNNILVFLLITLNNLIFQFVTTLRPISGTVFWLQFSFFFAFEFVLDYLSTAKFEQLTKQPLNRKSADLVDTRGSFLDFPSREEIELTNEITSNDVTSVFKLPIEPHPEELLSLKIQEKRRQSEQR